MTRWRLTVEYDGGPFMGWQRQDHGPSVQQALEEALERMTGERAVFTAAGRTDAGVHALAMSTHVDVAKAVTAHRLREGLNALVRPQPISVLDVAEVAEDWHARFSCAGRRYLYRILSRRAPPALDAGRVWHVAVPLDAEAMREAAAHLVGEHDFTSFRASSCQSPTPVKTLQPVTISRRGPYWRFEFEANAFLHHMIRNLMGCLVQVGQGLQPPGWMREVLEAKSRDAAAPTFSPDGLYFLGPVYDVHWGLPSHVPAYDGLP